MRSEADERPRVHVRQAVKTDAVPLSSFAAARFRETYASTSAPADLEAHITTHLRPEVQAAEIAAVRSRTLLAEVRGTLAGFAQIVRGPLHPVLQEGTADGAIGLEIRRFYVAPEWHGRGVAQQLMSACLAAEPRDAPMWLGVFASNLRAIAFYTKCGFDVVGETTFVMGSDPQRDFVMRYAASRRRES